MFTSLVIYALISTVTEYAIAMGSSATIAGLVLGIYVFGGLCSRVYSGNALEKKRLEENFFNILVNTFFLHVYYILLLMTSPYF